MTTQAPDTRDTPTRVAVVLRRWRAHPRTLIALFPLEDEGNGMVLSYEHIGQHGPAAYRGVISRTTPVRGWDDEDAKALDRELKRIGYQPRYYQREPKRRSHTR
jgi:hypothetical protein